MNGQAAYVAKAFLLLLCICSILISIDFFINNQQSSSHTTIVEEKTAQPISDPRVGAGKALFLSKCASCHNIFKDMTGPALYGFEERGPWADRKNVYAWIKNPAAFMEKNEYAKALKEKFKTPMTAFPAITDQEIDDIIAYINDTQIRNSKPVPASDSRLATSD